MHSPSEIDFPCEGSIRLFYQSGTLVMPFDLTEAELVAIFDLARQVRALILMEDSSVGNFNFAK